MKIFEKLIKKQRVTFAKNVNDWKEAITRAAQPLVKEGTVEKEYITAMIDSVKEYGPYIVIAPDIAIPHAKKESAVNETSISFLKLEEPVNFGNQPEHQARLIFILASTDNKSHLSLLENMVKKLSDQEIVDRLLESKNLEDLKKL